MMETDNPMIHENEQYSVAQLLRNILAYNVCKCIFINQSHFFWEYYFGS